MAQFDEYGREIPDKSPAPPPPGGGALDLVARHLQMQAYIRREMSKMAEEQGLESFEEADDFDVDEDPDPLSDYELRDAAPEWPGGVKDTDPDGPDNSGRNTGSERAGTGLQGTNAQPGSADTRQQDGSAHAGRGQPEAQIPVGGSSRSKPNGGDSLGDHLQGVAPVRLHGSRS